MTHVTAWDRRTAVLAVGFAAIAVFVSLLVITTTDSGASWAHRAAMLGAVAPVAGAIGTLGALRLAEGRGELSALFAVGVSPSRAYVGAVFGGIAIALLGVFAASSRWADQSALFPTPLEARQWGLSEPSATTAKVVSSVSLRERTMGIQVDPGGGLTYVGEIVPDGSRPRSTSSVFFALTLCALSCPTWIATRAKALSKVVVGLVAVLLLIASFQAVATGRTSSFLLAVAPSVLLAHAAVVGLRSKRSFSSKNRGPLVVG